MKTTLSQVNKQAVFPEFSKDSPDSFHVTLAGVFGINQDVIEVDDNENIKFFHKDFVDVSLEAGRFVRRSERHDLILEIAVPCSEGYFPLVTLPNSHLMICVCQVHLGKTLGAT